MLKRRSHCVTVRLQTKGCGKEGGGKEFSHFPPYVLYLGLRIRMMMTTMMMMVIIINWHYYNHYYCQSYYYDHQSYIIMTHDTTVAMFFAIFIMVNYTLMVKMVKT